MRIGTPDTPPRPEIVGTAPPVRAHATAIAGTQDHVEVLRCEGFDKVDERMIAATGWIVFRIIAERHFRTAIEDRPGIHEYPLLAWHACDISDHLLECSLGLSKK